MMSDKVNQSMIFDIAKTAEEACEKQGIKLDNVMRAGQGDNGFCAIRTLGNILYAAFECHVSGRERALAKTKLEEAIMWAVKGYSSTQK